MVGHDSGTNLASDSLSAIECTLAGLWAEVLRSAELPSPDDDFFGLGGDSMTMVMLEYRIYEEFNVEVAPGAILNAPTLRLLSRHIYETRLASNVHA